MKNIHILQTDKPSRLLYNFTLKSFCIQTEKDGMFINDGNVAGAAFWSIEKANNNGFRYVNIYITSDEEIKEGDWILYTNPNNNRTFIVKCSEVNFTYFDYESLTLNIRKIPIKWAKKIILTTGQNLINDGVQAIDDEFLEWFVKNPSCEEVEVDKIYKANPKYKEGRQLTEKVGYWIYKIIIPKEEPKQDKIMERFIANAKQETLEDYLQRLKDRRTEDNYNYTDEDFEKHKDYISDCCKGGMSVYKCLEFMYFAKIDMDNQLFNREPREEISYSEEEVQVKLYECLGHFAQKHNIIINGSDEIEEWVEQFKKK